jgi:hypothetical protein
MIEGVGLGPDVITGIKLLVIDHQLAVKQMQFFHSGIGGDPERRFPARAVPTC